VLTSCFYKAEYNPKVLPAFTYYGYGRCAVYYSLMHNAYRAFQKLRELHFLSDG
jgi:hypothetical protein